jgi:ketosteroid isomerase-like protein
VNLRALAINLCVALALCGCVANSLDNYKAKNNDEAQILSLMRRIPDGIKARSLQILMLPYTEDLYVGNFHKYLGIAQPGAAIRISKAELRQVYAQFFKNSKEFSADIRDFQVTVKGDRATAEGVLDVQYKLEGEVRVRKEEREAIISNPVIWRLRRGPDGWRIYEEIFQ